jgi:hypothetical protein
MQLRILVRSVIALATIVVCSAANAQSFRAYVSSTGSDAHPCTVSAPCRLLPAALAAIADGGEVWMLDSANYNSAPVNVTKSATILAVPGAVGSVVAIGGPAITVATSGVKVVLRNLVIVPFVGGAGTDGISMTNGAALTIENCVIANMTTYSAVVVSASAEVKIADTVIRNVAQGVVLSNGARGNISNTKFIAAGYSLWVQAYTAGSTTIATVSDSVMSHGVVGPYVDQVGTGIGKIIATNITSSENGYGIAVTAAVPANALISVGNSTLSGNSGYGFYNAGGTVKSLGNNFVSDNGMDVSGTITPVAPR